MTNIVMLVRDRLKLTAQALQSLADNTDPEDYTLTVVDDGSSDFRVARLYVRPLESGVQTASLRIHNSDHVIARAKNLGVCWSEQTFGRGGWLYLSDSDVYFKPRWLETITRVAALSEDLGFRLWGGQIHPYHLPTADCSSGWGGLKEYCALDGPSWLMRWSTWDQVGPLNRVCAPGTCKGEDGEWCDRLRNLGARIGCVQPHVVIHTGLHNTAGEDTPGMAERAAQRVAGVLYE